MWISEKNQRPSWAVLNTLKLCTQCPKYIGVIARAVALHLSRIHNCSRNTIRAFFCGNCSGLELVELFRHCVMACRFHAKIWFLRNFEKSHDFNEIGNSLDYRDQPTNQSLGKTMCVRIVLFSEARMVGTAFHWRHPNLFKRRAQWPSRRPEVGQPCVLSRLVTSTIVPGSRAIRKLFRSRIRRV